ncbi:FG-GAP repeat domain-containing protein [Algoriphagus sp. PAP.12]|uniref:FG-GAP repeat domain-containing protein n=1 Tax=Algoriphagus sp. PAP.12 TaxID=2996678 RepID=UPI00227B023C|nr:VCBS repeat-containing protein [Algoriphagus sp. PAP.12]
MSFRHFITFLGFWVIFGPVKAFAQKDEVTQGKMLAETYCGACHGFPSPELLPKKIWRTHVLPQMAAYMGFQEVQDSLAIWEERSPEEIQILKNFNVYPNEAIIGADDFQKISNYYYLEAPEILASQKPKATPIPLEGFEAKNLFIEGIHSPMTSMVAINESRAELLISDANANQLYAKTITDELFTLPAINSPVVQFIPKSPGVFNFLTIGSITPSDLSQGALYEMDLNSGTWTQILDDLSRPVYGTWKDLEGDGKPDFLLCNYGHHVGNISIYKDGNFQSEPLTLGGAGARKLEVLDLNQDGELDIIALFAQGNERISVFYNQGNGYFSPEQILLRFSPLMGSSYFEMHDFNQDGLLDILYTNGDNWDYSSINKPYHGFRIFENKGNEQFEESWFYPQYGAAKAMALDFDQDGDLDIASIAFYDDLENPNHQFLLFENQGNMTFQPRYIPEASLAKWLTMDWGDLDGDGDLDIVLGAYNHNFREFSKLLIQGIKEVPSVLILEKMLNNN